MLQNKNNIWNKFEIIPFNVKCEKKSEFKSLKIKQVIALENGNEDYKNNNCEKILFMNKKRGRKNQKSNEPEHEKTHSKFTDDNLKRKIKTHFHNYIIALLNSKLNIPKDEQKIVRFGKMNSNITQNITVEYNRNLFKKKIKDIVIEVSDKYQNKQNNLECLEKIMENPKTNNEVIKLLNMTYEDLYLNYYLKSTKEPESYEKHKEKLRQKHGERYVNKFIKNAEELINFYNICKERKSRKKNASNSIGTSQYISKNNLSDNINNKLGNGILKKEEENEQIYSDKSTKEVFIQTEKSPYDEESEWEFTKLY
jgi:hypothetical protein